MKKFDPTSLSIFTGTQKYYRISRRHLLTEGTKYLAEQACGPLVMIPSSITDNMAEVMKTATAGQGAGIAWPALIRKLDRTDSSYRT